MQFHWWSPRLQLASPFSLNSNRSLQPHLRRVAVIRMVTITVSVGLIRICLTLYLHLLCACMTYMYLSAIVAAKKISFIRMMVSPAASIIQFDFQRGPYWWGLRSEIISKYHLNRAMITLFEDKKTPPPPWWPAYAMMIPHSMTSTDGPHKIIQGC